MVLPLGLLRCAEGHPMLVELKNGETFNGHLVACDNYMNLTLREVILTAPDGERFWRLAECYVKGANIKYVRVPNQIIDLAKQSIPKKKVLKRDEHFSNQRNPMEKNGSYGGTSSNRGRK